MKENKIDDYPGLLLERELIKHGLNQSDLAKRTGLTTKTINTIIKGGASISPDTAVLLQAVLGLHAEEWLKLEAIYQINKINAIQLESMQEDLSLLRQMDLKGIIKRGWIEKLDAELEQLKAVLSFFGVSSIKQLSLVWSQLNVNYRTSEVYQKNHYNIMLWLRRGELLALDRDYKPYSSKTFKEALIECRKLTTSSFEEAYTKIQKICGNAGVAVEFVRELPKISTSGAAQWINKGRALIQLSLRGKKDDLFWFSFFHEAGHVLLHGRKDQFLDNNKNSVFYSPERTLIEAEADAFSANFLISKKMFADFIEQDSFTEESIKNFSSLINIAPGIVIGQLQNHGLLKWSTKLNKLKQTYDFPPELDC